MRVVLMWINCSNRYGYRLGFFCMLDLKEVDF